MPAKIRQAQARDLNRLVEIYNHYVTGTHATFDTQAFAVGARTHWFTRFAETGPYRLLVAESDDDVIGYASSQPFKPKPGYVTSVETTIYLDPAHTGNGLGFRLYGHLVHELVGEASLHRAYGGIAQPNEASVALHEKLGFRRVAMYHEVGYKFDTFWDVHWYERDLTR